jgi:hypothetical protein
VNYYTSSSKKNPLILHEFFLAETHVTGAYQVRKTIFRQLENLSTKENSNFIMTIKSITITFM